MAIPATGGAAYGDARSVAPDHRGSEPANDPSPHSWIPILNLAKLHESSPCGPRGLIRPHGVRPGGTLHAQLADRQACAVWSRVARRSPEVRIACRALLHLPASKLTGRGGFMSDPTAWESLANKVAEERDADVLFYSGPLRRHEDSDLIDECVRRRRRKNVVLILATYGGNPDSAYRIARCLGANYTRFTVYVPGLCKSAGALVAIGGHELVMGPLGELGPLDIQIGNKDEVFELRSTLTADAALSALQQRAFFAYQYFLRESRRKSISTKIASEVAVKLACGLFSEIYSQIDPMHVGEAARSLSISRLYGQRLAESGGNLEEEALATLVSTYPSHGFVIDFEESKKLFKRIRQPDLSEALLVDSLGALALRPDGDEPIHLFLSGQREDAPKAEPGANGGGPNESKQGGTVASEPAVGAPGISEREEGRGQTPEPEALAPAPKSGANG